MQIITLWAIVFIFIVIREQPEITFVKILGQVMQESILISYMWHVPGLSAWHGPHMSPSLLRRHAKRYKNLKKSVYISMRERRKLGSHASSVEKAQKAQEWARKITADRSKSERKRQRVYIYKGGGFAAAMTAARFPILFPGPGRIPFLHPPRPRARSLSKVSPCQVLLVLVSRSAFRKRALLCPRGINARPSARRGRIPCADPRPRILASKKRKKERVTLRFEHWRCMQRARAARPGVIEGRCVHVLIDQVMHSRRRHLTLWRHHSCHSSLYKFSRWGTKCHQRQILLLERYFSLRACQWRSFSACQKLLEK